MVLLMIYRGADRRCSVSQCGCLNLNAHISKLSVLAHVFNLRLSLVYADEALGPWQSQLLTNVEFLSFAFNVRVQVGRNFYVVFGNVSPTPMFNHMFPIVISFRFDCFLSVQPFISHPDAVVVLMLRIVQVDSILRVLDILICKSHFFAFMVVKLVLAHVAQAKSAMASYSQVGCCVACSEMRMRNLPNPYI